jgi:hypothetical protein
LHLLQMMPTMPMLLLLLISLSQPASHVVWVQASPCRQCNTSSTQHRTKVDDANLTDGVVEFAWHCGILVAAVALVAAAAVTVAAAALLALIAALVAGSCRIIVVVIVVVGGVLRFR